MERSEVFANGIETILSLQVNGKLLYDQAKRLIRELFEEARVRTLDQGDYEILLDIEEGRLQPEMATFLRTELEVPEDWRQNYSLAERDA